MRKFLKDFLIGGIISAVVFLMMISIGVAILGGSSSSASSSSDASGTLQTGNVAEGGEGTIGVYTSTSGKKYNLYFQGSPAPWADNGYGDGGSNPKTMAYAGCGPTAEAIIASGYNGDITPETARADIIGKHGGAIANYSSASEIAASLKRIVPGIKAEAGSFDESKIKECLKKGGQVWLIVTACKFTDGSHCIALIDYDENKGVYVAHGTAKSKPYGWESLSYVKSYNKAEVAYVGGN